MLRKWDNMSLEAKVVSCQPGLVQMVRYDDMFECGRGIVVMWPEQGGSYIPATGEGKCGIDYLMQIAKEYGLENNYKLKQAYFKLMLSRNYDQVNIKVR